MSMNVLFVLDPLRTVGVAGCGDAERLVERLAAALVAAGHLPTVVASEGSRVAGRLVETSASGSLDEVATEQRELVGELIANGSFDLVHLHGKDAHRFLPATVPPVLVTLHDAPDHYDAGLFGDGGPVRISCVSGSQRRACPASPRLVESVPPGASAERPVRTARRYVVAAGALPRSGPVRELSGAGYRILFLAPGAIAELVPSAGAPALVPRRGVPSRERERRLLAGATAVLAADGARNGALRTAIESLVLGTPVVALRGGPLADVVEHGRTGLLVDDPPQLAAAALRAAELDREQVRATALRRFDGAKMVRRYLQLYERLVRGTGDESTPFRPFDSPTRSEEATG